MLRNGMNMQTHGDHGGRAVADFYEFVWLQLLEYHVVPGVSDMAANFTNGEILQTALPNQTLQVRLQLPTDMHPQICLFQMTPSRASHSHRP